MKERLQRLAVGAAHRPVLTVVVTVTLALAGTLLALGLRPSAGSDTFVSRSSDTFQATDQDHRLFGGDAVVILVREPLTDLVQTKDLATISFLGPASAASTWCRARSCSPSRPRRTGPTRRMAVRAARAES